MADQLITTTETAAIIPEIWSARFYDVLLASLVFEQSIDRSYEGEIQALGDLVNISTIPEFAEAQELAEDQRADAKAVTITGQQLVINKRTACDYIITKRSQLQSLEFMDGVRDKAVHAINKKVQADIISTSIPSAATPDHQIPYDSGSTLALADILEAKELLDTANVPMGSRKMILDSPQWNDLFNITGFNSKDFIPAGSPLSSGQFTTQLAGFDALLTTEVSGVSHFFHPSFLTIAMQQSLNIAIFDLGVDGKRASRVNVDILWGLKQLDNTRIVEIA